MSDSQSSNSSFWVPILVGVLSSLLTIYVQHFFSKKEKVDQLFLDEKKDFVGACDEYLSQYRNWHELMNYYVNVGSGDDKFISEFDSTSARQAYIKWKKDFDFAYGKVFLLSNNEFGPNTLAVSQVLHDSLQIIILADKLTVDQRQSILRNTDNYFFGEWLVKAQQEIFRYNSGERNQKTIADVVAQQQAEMHQKQADDSIDEKVYQEYLNLLEYQRKQDSIENKPHREIQIMNKKELQLWQRHPELF